MNRLASKNTSLETPIGTLSFGIKADAGDVDDFRVLVRPVNRELPWGMSVEGCVAVLLQGLSYSAFENLKFYCKWDGLKQQGMANSGEALEAWEWESDGKLVMIGTEASDRLNERLNYQGQSTCENISVAMTDNTISVRLGKFAAGKMLSLHFLVAWNPSPEPISCSCWYAVEMSHPALMESLNPNEKSWDNFPHIAKKIGAALYYRVGPIHEPEVTPNFSYVEYTGRFDLQEGAKRYLLCSYDGRWAVCSHVESDERGIKLQFVDCAEIAVKLKEFYGINVMSKAELEAEFQLLPDLPYMSESDLKYWKPKTMGAALFNWWD
ncbi:MAG: hypothetical protein PHH47_10970 [Gallionella sp.]|nr:hypothetical protein [Gallionella sp.]MDD4946539.1 hypothetical protein [Gallionella sp.]